jgi:hypothetical protein
VSVGSCNADGGCAHAVVRRAGGRWYGRGRCARRARKVCVRLGEASCCTSCRRFSTIRTSPHPSLRRFNDASASPPQLLRDAASHGQPYHGRRSYYSSSSSAPTRWLHCPISHAALSSSFKPGGVIAGPATSSNRCDSGLRAYDGPLRTCCVAVIECFDAIIAASV